MKSFHSDPKIKEKCTQQVYDPSQYPVELGLPEWLGCLEDSIFKGIPIEDAEKFTLQFFEAIPVGVDESVFKKLKHNLAIQRLEILLEQQKEIFPEDDYSINAAIELTIQYHKNPIDSSAARSAARSAAEAAAEFSNESDKFAAQCAAKSAEFAAEAAAESARSATESNGSIWFVVWSAELAAESSALSARYAWSSWSSWSAALTAESAALSEAWEGERDRLIAGLKELEN